MVRRSVLAALAALAVAVAAVLPSAAQSAQAAESFDPGNIIADQLFYDGSAMTSAQIQTFLDKKVGTCASSDCINILRASVSSRTQNVSGTTGNVICKAFTGGTNLRISEIIYRAQVACGISAKVILVTLQKEQGLVTSTNPSQWNLDHAMGQACPDTAPCDPAYAGIGVQIISGTTQLKTYKAAKFGRQVGTYAIRYSPDASCGSKTVNVRNYGTAALYNYTPYTPNAAALKNLDATGDACSSYGNRNFWRDYTRWFGSTQKGSVSTIDTVAHLIALDSSGELWAYPTNGKAGWLPRVSLGAPWKNVTRLVAPGDLDGDGHRDLITVAADGSAQLHRGDGILGYDDPQALTVDWSGAVLLTDAGDFSGDGIPDVFTTDASGRLLLWRGTGGAGFRAPITVGNGWSGIDLLIGAGDFSGDGKPDVIARRTDGALFLYRGNGRGGWSGSMQIGTGWNGMAKIAVAGDVNGDGRADLFGIDRSGGLWLYPGTTGGKVKSGTKVGSGWSAFTAIADPGPKATGLRPFPAGVGDVDGDLHRDILATTTAGQLVLYSGNGSGGFRGSSVVSETTPPGARYLPAGDFDGDGVSDLARIDTNGALSLLPGDGAGGYGDARQIGTGWGGLNLVFGGIDFDGDRKPDLIARDSSGALLLYRGNGTGGFVGGSVQIGTGWGAMTAIFSAGAFDGDRFPDLIARRSDGTLYLYSGNGAGGFRATKQIGSGWGRMTALLSPGDFNSDGRSDVVARRSDGTLYLYPGNGSDGFTTGKAIGVHWNGIAWMD